MSVYCSGTKTTIPTVPIWDRPVSRRSISAQNLDLPANVDFKARPLNSKVLDAPVSFCPLQSHYKAIEL